MTVGMSANRATRAVLVVMIWLLIRARICRQVENKTLYWFCMSGPDTKQWSKNRRSQRIELYVPVLVYRPPGDGPPFYEPTQTLVVSAHGALFLLADLVARRQLLFVQNRNTGEQEECRVISVKNEPIGPSKVAVEFTKPVPRFWHVAYPPADWIAGAPNKLG